jgi:ureidoglycolate hydrolase
LADIVLRPIALTAEAFAPFGDVIDTRGRAPLVINEGTCRRFDDLASIDVAAGRLRVFLSSGNEGVNYRRNVWHHSLLALARPSRFLVIDRGGPLDNCEEKTVDAATWVST